MHGSHKMNIVVIGAGIAGVCTAMELSRRGHTVTVLEAASEAAAGASYANAGLLSPGHCFSWAEPGIAGGILKAFLTGADRPRIGAPRNKDLIRWLRRFIKQSSPANWHRNSGHALQLARFSRTCLFSEDTVPLPSYGAARSGLLYLYKAEEEPAELELKLLKDAGEPYRILRGYALHTMEPSLDASAASPFDKGTYCEMDAYGDARQYALEGVRFAKQRGVDFRWNTTAREIITKNACVVGVATDDGFIGSDACIVSGGYASRRLLAPLGYDLMIHPVSGYSLTYENVQGTRPQHGGVSISDKIAWAPFGDDRIRFTGFADLGTPSEAIIGKRFKALEAFAHQLCPSVQEAKPAQWVGQRPMTPDGLPYLGAAAHGGLHLNCGHGAMGWTMAHGSARLIAQAVEGQAPEIDLTPFRHDRRFS